MGWVVCFDRISVIRGRFPAFWTESSHGVSALMKDQAVEVVSEVGESQFGFGAGETDGADEQAKPHFLVSEDVLDPGADGGFPEVGGAGAFRHPLPGRRLRSNLPRGGLPCGLRRWMLLMKSVFTSHFSLLCER